MQKMKLERKGREKKKKGNKNRKRKKTVAIRTEKFCYYIVGLIKKLVW